VSQSGYKKPKEASASKANNPIYIKKDNPKPIQRNQPAPQKHSNDLAAWPLLQKRMRNEGLCELLWLKRLLMEIDFGSSMEMNIFRDNKVAIDILQNPIQHDRTKNVEVDRYFIKQNLEEKIIQFPFVKSKDQLADILTKAVSDKNFHNSLDKLSIKDIYAPT